MKVELDIQDSALSALRQAPAEFAACLRLMAAAKLYETGILSKSPPKSCRQRTRAIPRPAGLLKIRSFIHLKTIRTLAGE